MIMTSATRLHAFLTLVIVSVFTALAAGIPLSGVPETLTKGFGATLASVALLVGLGAMIGRLVEHSGGAKSLAEALIGKFGEDKAPLALGVASLIMGFPIFFDAGLIVMLPVVFAVGRRLNGPLLAYGIPVAGAFSVMHVFLPPHPGPVAASEFFGADIGLILLFGLLIAIPTWYLSGYRWGLYLGKRYHFKVSDLLLGPAQDDAALNNPASPGVVVGIMAIPMALIFGNTGLSTLAAAGVVDKQAGWVQLLVFLGQTSIALLITTLVAMVVLGLRRGVDKANLEKLLDGALGPICSVVLITGAGGMFGQVLRTSGICSCVDTCGFCALKSHSSLTGRIVISKYPSLSSLYLIAFSIRRAVSTSIRTSSPFA